MTIALSLAEALEHLHANGLVHRDVKPSNVIFVNGRPKLADIGLVAQSDSTLSFVGTEGYVPPEGPGKPQADLFSLGKVFYEMATGKDRKDFPLPPDGIQKSPDHRSFLEFNEITLRACESSIHMRYPNAGELVDDLKAALAGKSVRLKHAVSMETRRGSARFWRAGDGITALDAPGRRVHFQRADSHRSAPGSRFAKGFPGTRRENK